MRSGAIPWRIVVLCLALLSAQAMADPFPGKITVGPSKLVVRPPESSIAGYRSLEYPVRLTNFLIRPVWFFGHFQGAPVYRIFMRSQESDPWEDKTMGLCGLGDGLRQIPPGKSVTFTVSVPASDLGKQFRIEIPLYKSPDPLAPGDVGSSAAVIVQEER